MGVDKENMTFLTLGGDKQKPLMYHRNKYRTWWAVVWGRLVQFTTFSYFSALSTCNLQYSSACTHIVLLCFISMWLYHYDDVTMGTMAAQITSLAIVYSTFYLGADQSKHQSFASMAFVWGIHRGPVNSPHKWPVTRKMFPFDDVIMIITSFVVQAISLSVSFKIVLLSPVSIRFPQFQWLTPAAHQDKIDSQQTKTIQDKSKSNPPQLLPLPQIDK